MASGNRYQPDGLSPEASGRSASILIYYMQITKTMASGNRYYPDGL